MKHPIIAASLALVLVASAALGQGSTGPDVIVGDIPASNDYGSVGNIAAFSLATTSCNIGTQLLAWDALPNLTHPVIAQDMYRIKNGEFTQIGISWLKHSFLALNNSLCNACNNSPGNTLGVGCSDPYGAGLNGQQGNLGPRSQVNASTGIFPIPSGPPVSTTIDRRLQINHNDLDPSLNIGAIYLAEAQYVTADDAAAGNNNNNASWRPASFAGVPGGGYSLTLTGGTTRKKAAIEAWPLFDPGVTLSYVDVPNDGRFIVGYNRILLPNGYFKHVWAIENLNSHRGAQALSAIFPLGATVQNPSFHKIDHHSGEPYSTATWNPMIVGNTILWQNDAPFNVNQNANALRWGCCNTFTVESNATVISLTLDLFRPGTPTVMTIPVPAGGGWQQNQAGASFGIGGAPSTPNGPIFVEVTPGTLVAANISSTTIGAPWDLGMTSTPPVANVGITPGSQIVNLDIFHPSFHFLFNMQGTSIAPGGSMTLPFTTPSSSSWEWAGQLLVADAAAADGLWFSAPVEFHSRACAPGNQPLNLGGDDFVQISVGPGTNHPCVPGIPFAGSTFTTFAVNSNGSVTFGPGDPDFSPTTVEFITGASRLAGMWTDLSPDQGGSVSVTSTAGGALSVSFLNVPQFQNPAATSSFTLNFDSASGGCSISYQGSSSHTLDTLVGLNPGPGSTGTQVNWGNLANQPTSTGGANQAVYQITTASAPSGFSLIFFPNANATSYSVF